jgi:hypothetical protein
MGLKSHSEKKNLNMQPECFFPPQEGSAWLITNNLSVFSGRINI